MKTLSNFIIESSMINEMARVNDSNDKMLPYNKYEVSIFNETDKAEKNIPHFHFVISEHNVTIKVLIDNIDELDILGISGNRTSIKKDLSNVWSVYSKEKKKLKKWLSSKNHQLPNITNYEAIKFMWNSMNQ